MFPNNQITDPIRERKRWRDRETARQEFEVFGH
jgi:hypothetical protein